MLNYIWFALLAIGITFAIVNDTSSIVNDEFGKNEIVSCRFSDSTKTNLIFDNNFAENFNLSKLSKYDANVISSTKNSISIEVKSNLPNVLKQIAEYEGNGGKITLQIISVDGEKINVKFPKVNFEKVKKVTNAVIDSSKTAVNIALGLIGIMALWLGVMKIAEKAGLIKLISKSVKPLTKFLFPDVPNEHPAIAAMIMNISANMLGLGNAATPFGLKAMEELENLNPEKGTATNAMCTFLAINTSGLTLIPATAIAIRAAQGSSNPTLIIGTSFLAAFAATLVGVTVAKIFEYISKRKKDSTQKLQLSSILKIGLVVAAALSIFVALFLTVYNFLFTFFTDFVSITAVIAIPLIILIFLIYGLIKKVKVYEEFVDGAKEGFNIAVKIIPYLVGMIVAIGVFRAGGGMELFVNLLSPITNLINFPAEVLPMALMRPLSGSGSIGIMTELMTQYGPDSFIGVLSSTILGSTETTFYVLAVYFGAVNIRKTRHAVIAGVSADIAGILTALVVVRFLFN